MSLVQEKQKFAKKPKAKIQMGTRVSMHTKAALLLYSEMLEVNISDLIAKLLDNEVERLVIPISTKIRTDSGKGLMNAVYENVIVSTLKDYQIDIRVQDEYAKLESKKVPKKGTNQ